MDTRLPPHLGDTAGELLVESQERVRAFRRAHGAAAKAASLREGGDEFAAVAAEIDSRTWLRKFAALNEQLPGGSANQDFPIAKV